MHAGNVASLLQQVVGELERLTVATPQPPANWDRSADLRCDCADCATVMVRGWPEWRGCGIRNRSGVVVEPCTPHRQVAADGAV